jgi:MFS family permease
MARDALVTAPQVVLAPASKVLFSPQAKYVLAAVFLITAVFSLLLATKLKARYDRTLKAGISGFRWLLIGVSAGLMLEFSSILAGVTDVMTLKLIGGMIVVTTILGWVSDRENSKPKNAHWLAFIASLFTGALAWAPLLGTLFGTWYWGLERFGWWVYALAAALFIGFVCYALMQYWHLAGKKNWKDYLFTERNFLGVDILTKLAFGIIIIVAFMK